MARRSKKISGTTTRVGKVSTSPVARVSADSISRPHSGKKAVVKGAESIVEAEGLRGHRSQAPRSSVKQIGPTNILPPSGRGKPTKIIGAGMGSDLEARREMVGPPGTRQSGSVTSIGPADPSYTRLTERSGPTLQTQQARYKVKPSGRPIVDTPLLKSGVGRAHPWSVAAGSPGSLSGRAVQKGGGESGAVLISGRKRAFKPEPFAPNRDWVAPSRSVVPGS